MHPDLYLVIYQRQEREMERRLRWRLLQTCCAMLVAARRARWASFVERLTGRRDIRWGPACCPA
jgi:hypothetical protein